MKEENKEKKKRRSQEIKETSERYNAFKLYCKLTRNNEDNILDKVAEEFGKKKKTIYNWSSALNWKEREEKIREESRRKALHRLTNRIADRKVEGLNKLIDNLQIAENNLTGSLDGYYSVNDIVGLTKLFELLTGEPTENSQSTVKYKISEEELDVIENLGDKISNEIKETELDMGKGRGEE